MSHLPRAAFLVFFGLLAACGDGQPLFDDGTDSGGGTDDGGTDGGDGDGDLDTGPDLPPGTEDPSSDEDILRFEARDDVGGGYVTNVDYDSVTDTFTVDNLAFDGQNVYQRGDAVSSMNGFAVYEADLVAEDSLTGSPIGQIVPYRALLGISENTVDGEPRTSFAIVRTGGYVNYGFGGFIYERNGGVILPTGGQAAFSGDYAGMRVFTNSGGLEYTRGDMVVAIDFEDFNSGPAVRGSISNREAFDINGNPIALGTGEGELQLPVLTFVIAEGVSVLDENGEMTGELTSTIVNGSGALELYESGTYYGILAGDMTAADGGEIVGVIVIESEDPRFEGVTAQETGGFILYR
jgi:hypothetical protein